MPNTNDTLLLYYGIIFLTLAANHENSYSHLLSTSSKTYIFCSDFVPSCYFTNTEVMTTYFELTLS